MDRRTFLEYLGAITVTPALAGSQEVSMYGMIAKLTIVPGKRDEMIALLKEGTSNMPGCFSYIVAKDATDENVMWVTEVWDTVASHDASFALPAVKNAVAKGKELVASFEKVAVTSPVWGVGLPPAR